MKRHEPGPPLLFTMIMNAIVMPRTTSSDRRRRTGDMGAVAGWIMVGAAADFVISEWRSPLTPGCPYPTRSGHRSPRAACDAAHAVTFGIWRSQPNPHFIHRAE